jgi:hypothetical protein
MSSNSTGDAPAGAASAASSLMDERSRKPRPVADLPSCFNDLNNKNVIDHSTVVEETVVDKKTGEETRPFRVATHIKVVVTTNFLSLIWRISPWTTSEH